MLLLITGDSDQGAALEAALKADLRTCRVMTANIHHAAELDAEWSEHYRKTVVVGAGGSAYLIGDNQFLGEIQYDPANPGTGVEEVVKLLARGGCMLTPGPAARDHRRPFLPHGGLIGGPSGT